MPAGRLPDNIPVMDSQPSFMQRKIAGVPAPIFVGVVVLAGFLVWRHYRSSTSTSGVSSGTAAPDPNAIDPNTGLTYGAEEQAATGALAAGSPSTNGTGAGGVGAGISLGDLEGLLSAMQGLGSTNYYYGGGGSGVSPTPTSPDGPGSTGGGGGAPSPSSTTPSTTHTQTSGSQGGGAIKLPSTVSGSGPLLQPIVNIPQEVSGSGSTDLTSFNLPSTQFGGAVPSVAPYTPPPSSPNAPYTTTATANPTGGSATKKQGTISIH